MSNTETPVKQKGLVIINTGDGKGKSTAGFGMLLRAWGRGMKVTDQGVRAQKGVEY